MTNITLPLDIESLRITSQSFDNEGDIILSVVSEKTSTPCNRCGKDATKRNGFNPEITIEHTQILKRKVFLKIKPVRYECKHCDDGPTTTERYHWCEQNAKVTKSMESHMMLDLIHSTTQDVAIKNKMSYKTVVSTLERSVSSRVDWQQYTDLETIGIDEISCKKGHKDYMVIVSYRATSGALSVIATLPDRSKTTILNFLQSIPTELRKTVRSVCTDMWDAYVYAALKVFGQQVVVIDRFHVAKQYRAPIDQCRIQEMRRLKATLPKDEYQKLHGVMWILRKKHECLSSKEKEALELLYHYSPKLQKANELALGLTHIFNTHSTRKSAVAKIKRWIKRAEGSGLAGFNRFIKMLKKYKGPIANYFKSRQSSGFVEGLNNKIKVLKRRCYGLKSPESYFRRLWLDLQGYQNYMA